MFSAPKSPTPSSTTLTPWGKEITINGIPFTVVGVFEEKDPNNMSGMDRYVLIPIP